jgi:hypothetical protein
MSEMQSDSRDGLVPLRAELVELRAALRELKAPAPDEDRLRAAARRHAVSMAAKPVRSGERRGRAPLAVAAAVAVAAMAALIGVTRHGDAPFGGAPLGGQPALEPGRSEAPVAEPRPDARGAFQPLLYSRGVSPAESYSIVRVRIPLSSLAPGQDPRIGGSVEADLLVGEDGLATGIRFNSADTLFVTAASQ